MGLVDVLCNTAAMSPLLFLRCAAITILLNSKDSYSRFYKYRHFITIATTRILRFLSFESAFTQLVWLARPSPVNASDPTMRPSEFILEKPATAGSADSNKPVEDLWCNLHYECFSQAAHGPIVVHRQRAMLFRLCSLYGIKLRITLLKESNDSKRLSQQPRIALHCWTTECASDANDLFPVPALARRWKVVNMRTAT